MAEEVKREHGGARPGAGRKSTGKVPGGQTVSVYLTAEQAEYLKLVCPSNNSLAVRELLDRARKMWPKG